MTPRTARARRHPAAFRRWLAALAACGAALLVGACGSGEQADPFRPNRLVAFGDEWSVIDDAGRKYTINAVASTGTGVDCALNPVWVQVLANRYNFVFEQCNPDAQTVAAFMRAQPEAKVADVLQQFAAFLAAGSPTDRDLTSVMVGVNDVLEVYRQYSLAVAADPTVGLQPFLNELENRGKALALGINRVVARGPRLIVSTIPYVDLSPWGLNENAQYPDANPTRRQVLKDMVNQFNNGLRVNILNDGNKIGLIFGDQMSQNYYDDPASFGIVFPFADEVACVDAAPLPLTTPTPLLACTDAAADLAAGATSTNTMWADTLRFAPNPQGRLGELARERAQNNPF
jgi:hypothetical protein